jgi:hypothetical protein
MERVLLAEPFYMPKPSGIKTSASWRTACPSMASIAPLGCHHAGITQLLPGEVSITIRIGGHMMDFAAWHRLSRADALVRS